MSLNLVDCIERGMDMSVRRPSPQYFKWIGRKLGEIGGEWQEDRIHVSDYPVSLPGSNKKCPRQLWLRYHGYDRKEETLGERIMWSQGKAFQYRMSYYIKCGLPKGYRVRGLEFDLSTFTPNHDLGSADLTIITDDNFTVVEIKTQRGKAFDYPYMPKPSHQLQLLGYIYSLREFVSCPVKGKLLYLDREGQNRPEEYDLDLEVDVKKASHRAHEIVEGDRPPIMEPELKIRHNKGPDSIKLKMPWQCRYCHYEGMSCEGALPEELRDQGIVAKASDGNLSWKTDSERIKSIVKNLYNKTEEQKEHS